MADWETELYAEEELLAAEVRAVLDEVADEFAAGLDTATELVAARFRVSSIGRMFRDRVPRLLRRLFHVAEASANDAADSVDAQLPDGWDDLPGRYDDGTLPPSLGDYAETTEHLLRAVGDRLAEAAVRALAEGLDDGEDIEALRARLRAVFDAEGAQLGQSREERIARTEAARAWNTATLAAAQDLSGEDRPLVKQWRTRGDTRVRDAHDDVDGQLRFLDEPFTVAGVPMQAPGDPTAPPELVIQCRCVLRLQRAPDRTSSLASDRPWLKNAAPAVLDWLTAFASPGTRRPDRPAMPTPRKPQDDPPAETWRRAYAAGLVPYTSDADAARAVGLENLASRLESTDEPKDAARSGVYESKDVRMEVNVRRPHERALAEITRRLSRAPSPAETQAARPESVTAAGEHTGGMIALIPSEQDAERLALDDGEAPGELHCTLWYLGSDVSDWTEDQRAELVAGIRTRAGRLPGPVRASAFGVNHWNPQGDDPVWVWAVSDTDDDSGDPATLHEARWLTVDALEDTHNHPDMPRQHSPWVAHVTGVYTSETWPLQAMAERLGALTFDRIRIAFAGEYTDIPLGPEEAPAMDDEPTAATTPPPLPIRMWSTPGDTALAYENQQTGDGRVFKPGALYWDGPGPWPLQYADEMLFGHEGAELAGAIQSIARDGDRIPGAGVLYLSQRAGIEAVMLLEQEAPLGVSVDLDDVDIELVDTTGQTAEDEGDIVLAAVIPSLSALHLEDGSWALSATTTTDLTASGLSFTRSRHTGQLITGPGGQVTAAAVSAALTAARVPWTGTLTAAAGDPDNTEDGVVVQRESSGDYLLRITRARVRGATLVSMPAYAGARIVLDPLDEDEPETASVTAAAPNDDHQRVITYVSGSPVPVGAREVADALSLSLESVRGHLARATDAGRLVRMAPGLYVGASDLPEGELSAAASGDLDLPVHEDRDAEWDGDQAASRVLDWATDDAGTVDPDRLSAAFLYRDDDGDPETLAAYKLGFADVFDGELHIVARGVYAVAGVLEGAMGGVDIPDEERDDLRDRTERLYARLAEAFDDPEIQPPWDTDEDGLTASAWTAMRELPAMPAAWFAEPTPEELPPGSGGVHYKDGRVYGWVAQRGEPHAGYPGQNLTIEKIAKKGMDFSHFLRANFALDDGSTVRAGAFTMNVGHHRDGAECETDACQFDDSRTVAGIITVGMNKGGLWFSGAAGPWLSDWDLTVFRSCQPSYHLKQGRGSRWELRAVLSVPVPGHSSPLVAAAIERSNLALTASAALADAPSAPTPDAPPTPTDAPSAPRTATRRDQHGHSADGPSAPTDGPSADVLVKALTAALERPEFMDRLAAAVHQHEANQAVHREEIAQLMADLDTTTITAAAPAGDAPKGDN